MDSSSATDIAKVVLPLLGGGLVGALITELFRRRRDKIQRLQLIERVNRTVSPIEGFTLAKTAPDGTITEAKDVHEFQLTLRNSTQTHLQNAEVKFEFLASDVEGIPSLPALSRTELVPIPTAKEDLKKIFRWSIPNFPSGDSVEFTFRTVGLQSEKFEAAIYSPGTVIERVVGEPPPPRKQTSGINLGAVGVGVAGLIMALSSINREANKTVQEIKTAPITEGTMFSLLGMGGCRMQYESVLEKPDRSDPSRWRVTNHIFNFGDDCTVVSEGFGITAPTTIKQGDKLTRRHESAQESKPRLIPLTAGLATSSTTATEIISVFETP